MAKVVYEKRVFTDRNTGISTEYDYIAIKGTGEDSHEYEVQLKNLVQSEKMVLKMMYDLEKKQYEDTEVVTSKNGNVNVNRVEETDAADDFFSDMKED